MIFTPMEVGKVQKTYASVLESFQNHVQKNYAMDVAKSVRNLKKVDLDAEKPIRQTHPDLYDADAGKKAKANILQSGYDIEFQVAFERHQKRVDALEIGLYKAYADLRSDKWMSKVMRDRLDAHENKDKLQDDVVATLLAMSELMQAPQRAQYPYRTLTEALLNFLKCTMDRKQEESLIDWLGRTKQTRDIIKTLLGTRFLDTFVEKLPEYQLTTDEDEKKAMKENAFEAWCVYLLLRNSDQLKFG